MLMLVKASSNLYNYCMTSPDRASSIDDPSPTIPELVSDALGLQFEGSDDYATPNTSIDTFQTMGGVIVLQRLLPEFSNEGVLLLRDAITLQGETVPTTSGTVTVKPTSLFAGWINKLRGRSLVPNAEVPEDPLLRIEITDPIIGRTEQAHFKTYPECHALFVSQSSVSGSFTYDDEDFTFDSEQKVIEIGKLSYDPNDYHGRISPKGRRYYSLITGTNDVYRGRRFGGSISDTPIKNDRLREKTIEGMSSVLHEIQNSSNVIRW